MAKQRSTRRSLWQNSQGNVMYMTAGLLVPLLATVGTGIDLGQAYMAKSRLQQACDAGALAGRRSMADTSDFDETDQAAAKRMFEFNYPSDIYNSKNVEFKPERVSTIEVKAEAKARVSTIIMRMFGKKYFDLTANCNAKMEFTNADIMLVLDVTGSMRDSPAAGGAAKIETLRKEVMNFFDTVSTAQQSGTTIRYGLMPYSSNVNVGSILANKDSTWISNTMSVPSRVAVYEWKNSAWNFKEYNYKVIDYDVTNSKTSRTLDTESGDYGGTRTGYWNGCIRERRTVDFDDSATSIPSNALDLNIDLVPSNDDERWQMAMPNVVFPNPNQSNGGRNANANFTTTFDHFSYGEDDPGLSSGQQNAAGGWAACPAPAMNLTALTKNERSTFKTQVDQLQAIGGTYHDVGMIWGTRLLSTTGLFGAENIAAANGRPVNRNIIFMTDGVMSPNPSIYGFQGIEYIQRRVGSIDTAELRLRHNKRFLAACDEAKERNITVWVIGFDQALDDTMKACASGDKFFYAKDQTELKKYFTAIAAQVARLRISQ